MARSVCGGALERHCIAEFCVHHGGNHTCPPRFFFPAEDGIRDLIVTGVQTCALPISGEVGEVVHRSPHLMLGYFHDDERTAAAFQGGWFHSGDLATIDEEGYITIVDRKKDMI